MEIKMISEKISSNRNIIFVPGHLTIIIISNTMIFWKLVIKCPRKPREVCGIPEGEARGNSTNLPEGEGHLITNFQNIMVLVCNTMVNEDRPFEL